MLMQFCAFDEAYVERLRSGDPETQQHFVAYFSELIRLKSGKRLHSAALVEDVRQETFARVFVALRQKNGVRQPERLGAFVNAVCTNVLREYQRFASRQTAVDEDTAAGIPDSSTAIVERIAVSQQQHRVRQILEQLPERDRRVIKAVFLEERDKDEVCRELGVDRAYLRVLLCRAKQAFKSLYLRRMKAPAQPMFEVCPAA